MNSEKVKEIKKALETCMNTRISSCRECPYNYTNTNTKHSECFRMAEHALTLITDLENRLEVERIVAKKRSGKLEKAEHDRDRYSRRIAELEKECAKNAHCLMQFAERLKSKDCSVPVHKGFILIEDHAIDETLKEFINKKEKENE